MGRVTEKVTSRRLDDRHYVAIVAVAGGYEWAVIRAPFIPGTGAGIGATLTRSQLPEPTVDAAFDAVKEALHELQASE